MIYYRTNLDKECQRQEISIISVLSPSTFVSHSLRTIQEFHESHRGDSRQDVRRSSWDWSLGCEGRTWCFHPYIRSGRISCCTNSTYLEIVILIQNLKINMIFDPGRRHSPAYYGPFVPLSVLYSTKTLHDPHQSPSGWLRLWSAPVPTVRQIFPRRLNSQLVRRLRHGRRGLSEGPDPRGHRVVAGVQQDEHQAVQVSDSHRGLDWPYL